MEIIKYVSLKELQISNNISVQAFVNDLYNKWNNNIYHKVILYIIDDRFSHDNINAIVYQYDYPGDSSAAVLTCLSRPILWNLNIPEYMAGETAIYDNKLYIAKKNVINTTSSLTPDKDTSNWDCISNFKNWVESKGYLTADKLPGNHVTTDTAQTISGTKTFTAANTTVKTLKSDQVDIKESISMQYDNTKKCLKFVFK